MSEPGTTSPQVVLITGASSGIGRAAARAFAAEGASLVLSSRSADALAVIGAACETAGAAVLIVPADVGDEVAVTRLFDAAVERFGRVDVVVHSAASVGYGRFEDVPTAVFDRIVTTNLLGAANVSRIALRHFRNAGSGNLVIISSLLGKVTVPLMGPYSISKAAVHALGRTLQMEARETPGISVSLISPGSINTPAYTRAANYTSREGRPPPPVFQPEKVARAIVRAARRPVRDRNVSITNPIIIFGYRLLPPLFDLLVGPLVKLMALTQRPVPKPEGTVFESDGGPGHEYGRWPER